MHNINYFNFDQTNHPISDEINEWIQRCLVELALVTEQINYVFCTDEELLTVNKEFLNHDYYTDIITFDLRDNTEDPLLADIFISLERVNDNAQNNNIENSLELKRVMIHGILHICGYSDKTPESTAVMREKENHFIYL